MKVKNILDKNILDGGISFFNKKKASCSFVKQRTVEVLSWLYRLVSL